MKYLIPISCLMGLAIVGIMPSLSALSPSPLSSKPSSHLSAQTPANLDVTDDRDTFYMSDRFGFRFVLPSGYVTTPSERQSSTTPAQPLQELELWQQVEFPQHDRVTEPPPNIRISIYPNLAKLPLTAWKGELSRPDDRPLTIAGQPAIAYTATGLYESDQILLTSPDDRYVMRLTVAYSDVKAPIRQAFQTLVSSFQFDVEPVPGSPSRWRINYTRLQNLLAAQNWQAANLETRAILQRLAGKNDLLFGSQAAFASIPITDLQTLDRLWLQASQGRFGFSVQRRLWQQTATQAKTLTDRVNQLGQRVGWLRSQPLPEDNPVGIELGSSPWRLDIELDYTINAPVGHLPWLGISASRLRDYLTERSLGCGSCTIDAIYLAGDRFNAYLPVLMRRFP